MVNDTHVLVSLQNNAVFLMNDAWNVIWQYVQPNGAYVTKVGLKGNDVWFVSF